MKSLWDSKKAKSLGNNPLSIRVYTSRLLGAEPDLVLHGGGNTSVKIMEKNWLGEEEEILYVKGSGWDLRTIEPAGFAPVRMKALLKMATMKKLADSEMVRLTRSAMVNPNAPNASVEAILHAIIPYKFVDHTHADVVVTITNTTGGKQKIKELYGQSMLIVPYVMPGFILAKKVYDMTRDVDWNQLEGIILLNHGIFTFDDDGGKSYRKMIKQVTKAETYIRSQGVKLVNPDKPQPINLQALSSIRKKVSESRGKAVLASTNQSRDAVCYSNLKNIKNLATRGPLTPDHVIRTKPFPVVFGENPLRDLQNFSGKYQSYFNKHFRKGLVPLDPAPRFAIWPGKGVLSFETNLKGNRIIHDIITHTIKSVRQAEQMGGWKALPLRDIFDVEYWELEQAKLKKESAAPEFQGKIGLVTGAASGIGKACVEVLAEKGAIVAALDINKQVNKIFTGDSIVPLVCDVTNPKSVRQAIENLVSEFGGLDLLVSNAGFFPETRQIEDMETDLWKQSLDLNLTSHQLLLTEAIPYLENGIEPSIVIVGSKNVPAPGPGAAAYSVAKAGLAQLTRVAAMELGKKGIRINMVHPNAVFDTGVWNPDIIKSRAKAYGLSVEEYKSNNLLKTEITSKDVAQLIAVMLGTTFSKTTAAQVPIDGGNERVI